MALARLRPLALIMLIGGVSAYVTLFSIALASISERFSHESEFGRTSVYVPPPPDDPPLREPGPRAVVTPHHGGTATAVASGFGPEVIDAGGGVAVVPI